MTESTDQTGATEELADMSVTDLALSADLSLGRYGDARRAGNVGMAERHRQRHVDAVNELTRRTYSATIEAERTEYVRAGLRLALDLATAQANITAARQAAAGLLLGRADDRDRDNYRDLLAAELAAMDALTAHLAGRP